MPQCGRTAGQVGTRTRQLSRTVSVSALAQASRSLGCDAGTLLLAAYGQVLLEWNGGQPFSVVTVHWDRPSTGSSIDNVVGDFTRLGWVSFAPGGRTPADFVARVQRQLDADAAHRSAEGLEVLRQFKDLSFPVVFTDLVRPIDAPARRRPGVRQVFCSSHTPQVTLDAIATPISDTDVQLQWDTAIDGDGRASEMFDRYVDMLQRWARELASEPPLHEAAAPAPALLADLATDGLHTLFERAAATYSARCALRFGDQALDYAELERRTGECAQWLRDQGVGPDNVVAVLMDRSIEMVVALLGIVRAGAAYLPVDVSFPRQRIALILGDAQVRCLLTQAVFAPDWIGEYDVLCLDDAHTPLRARTAAPSTSAGPRNLAYVIYTSGSTGSPKGCMIEHRSIVNRLAWMQQRFPLSPGDVVLQKTPYTFDVSVWEFFWPLIVGATLVVARPQGHLDGNYLLDLISRERIAVCHFVPSMLRTILQEANLQRMAGLRHVMVSGEELDYDLIEEFHGKVPVALENLYGPTEAAVDVSHWHAEVNAQRHTFIGTAIDGIALHVLDEHLVRVPDGQTGELYIAGVGVGRGYLNNPALTARSFLPDPFQPGGFIYKTGDLAAVHVDGNIRYHGRADTQIKLNGLRIELEEIEHHLRSHPQVKDAIVAVRELAGDKVLAAYVVPRSGTILPSGLRELLGLHLPRYMLPHAWGVIAVVPVTAHGKRSRKDLPAPTGLTRTPCAPAPHPVEKKLREMLDAIVASAQRSVVDDGARHGSREVDQND
jgi:amino acid adenylation domain-containing protein